MELLKLLIYAVIVTLAFFIAIPICVAVLLIGSVAGIATLPFVFVYRLMTGSLHQD